MEDTFISDRIQFRLSIEQIKYIGRRRGEGKERFQLARLQHVSDDTYLTQTTLDQQREKKNEMTYFEF